jgi:rhodanese-related sulfurtransferase
MDNNSVSILKASRHYTKVKANMEKITEILKRAEQRAQEGDLPYKGALLPSEAYAIMNTMPEAKLVDVRTKAEWDWVGRIPNAIEIEWASYPGMQPNQNFVSQLEEKVDPEALVMFICRSGGRSHSAAAIAAQAGYENSYNVLEGFEGDKDATGQRNKISGWRFAGLPWKQG